MSDSKKYVEELERQIKASTEDLRPTLALAVETIGEAMRKVPGGGAVPQLEGPDCWTWVDRRGKVYAVAPSPDANGHPMLTIRQPITQELGVWITTTQLLLGQTREAILRCSTVALVCHTGAFSGYQVVVREIAKRGDPMDGINKACEIADRDPSVNSALASAIREADDDKDPGGLN